MKKLFLILIILSSLLGSLNLVSCSSSVNPAKSEQSEEKVTYQCSMDCENGKTYDKPGQCPVCNMDLERVGEKSK